LLICIFIGGANPEFSADNFFTFAPFFLEISLLLTKIFLFFLISILVPDGETSQPKNPPVVPTGDLLFAIIEGLG